MTAYCRRGILRRSAIEKGDERALRNPGVPRRELHGGELAGSNQLPHDVHRCVQVRGDFVKGQQTPPVGAQRLAVRMPAIVVRRRGDERHWSRLACKTL